MEIDFQKIKDFQKRQIYQRMWKNDSFAYFQDKIAQTIWNGGVSENSYSFVMTGEKERDLREVFQIWNPGIFHSQFVSACGGSGQEGKRITTLHSSSLCALLFFYNVTRDNPILLTIQGRKVRFIQSVFEYQNTVFPGHTPSNVDIVLCGVAETGKSVILFLESKFAEYYLYAKRRSSPYSCDYLTSPDSQPFFDKRVMDCLGFQIEKNPADKRAFYLRSDRPVYMDGVKQMLAHYIGVRNLILSRRGDDGISKSVRHGAQIYLGEIVFDKVIGAFQISDGETALKSFQREYAFFAQEANRLLSVEENLIRFRVLEHPLTYSLFSNSDHKIEDKTKLFYFGG